MATFSQQFLSRLGNPTGMLQGARILGQALGSAPGILAEKQREKEKLARTSAVSAINEEGIKAANSGDTAGLEGAIRKLTEMFGKPGITSEEQTNLTNTTRYLQGLYGVAKQTEQQKQSLRVLDARKTVDRLSSITQANLTPAQKDELKKAQQTVDDADVTAIVAANQMESNEISLNNARADQQRKTDVSRVLEIDQELDKTDLTPLQLTALTEERNKLLRDSSTFDSYAIAKDRQITTEEKIETRAASTYLDTQKLSISNALAAGDFTEIENIINKNPKYSQAVSAYVLSLKDNKIKLEELEAHSLEKNKGPEIEFYQERVNNIPQVGDIDSPYKKRAEMLMTAYRTAVEKGWTPPTEEGKQGTWKDVGLRAVARKRQNELKNYLDKAYEAEATASFNSQYRLAQQTTKRIQQINTELSRTTPKTSHFTQAISMLKATEKKFTLEDVNSMANELLNNDKMALREELIDLTAVGEEGELRSDDEINDIWNEYTSGLQGVTYGDGSGEVSDEDKLAKAIEQGILLPAEAVVVRKSLLQEKRTQDPEEISEDLALLQAAGLGERDFDLSVYRHQTTINQQERIGSSASLENFAYGNPIDKFSEKELKGMGWSADQIDSMKAARQMQLTPAGLANLQRMVDTGSITQEKYDKMMRNP